MDSAQAIIKAADNRKKSSAVSVQMKKDHRPLYKYVYFCFAVFLILMLASRSSFLYVFNNWDDANSYLSVGKSIFHGKMPYRDVFDQKGMYLYFFYGLAYLVSHTTFAGVFLLEIVLGVLDVAGFYRILRLYTEEMLSVIMAPLVYVCAVSSRSFWWGGAAEEICLPFYVWGLYLIADYFRNQYRDRVMPAKTLLIGGILAGIIANIKFNGLGFYFAWMAVVWLAFLVHKDIKGSFRACLVFLFGMFLPFVPWLIYFGVQGGLYDWYWGYVFVNVFLYSDLQSEGPGLYERFYGLAKTLYWLIHDNFQYFGFVIPGLFFTLLEKGRTVLERLYAPLLFGFLYLGIFIGGRFLPYYALPLSIFAVYGFALAGRLVTAVLKDRPISVKAGTAAGLLCIACSLLFLYRTSMNIPFMQETKEHYFMFRFRDEVLEKEGPTLLNVGCLDAGLYTLTDVVPTCRWFQTQTLEVEDKANDPFSEQERYVREGLTDFVIARDNYPPCIYEQYDLIDQQDYSFSDYDFIYYLFRKKDL